MHKEMEHNIQFSFSINCHFIQGGGGSWGDAKRDGRQNRQVSVENIKSNCPEMSASHEMCQKS